MKNSIEEDMKILKGIIKGDEDCINAIYSQMKVKNDNDEDIQYYKKEIQSIKNIVDNYLKEKARADKLEKEYSVMLTESDENECDYKRVLKENEQLRKDIEGWKKYCEEIQEEQTEMSNKNCKLEFEVEKLQKENEELKEYLITQNCEINRLNLAKIRLELSQVPDTTEQYKYLKNEYKMRLERTDFENYKSNYISIQKVKDKIEEILNNGEYRIIFEGDAEFPDDATIIKAQKYIKLEEMQELIEEREKN